MTQLFLLLIMILYPTISSAQFQRFLKNQQRSMSNNKATFYTANDNTKYEIVNEYKRNDLFFTQGLTFKDPATLIESSGLNGESEIHYVDLPSLTLSRRQPLSKDFFGEGNDLIMEDEKLVIYYMTWKQRKVFKYNTNMELIDTLDLPNEIQEGWGMTHFTNSENKKKLLVSDGTNNIYHVDPKSFKVEKVLPIFYANGQPLKKLNELEMYKGALLSNIFLTNNIVKINPETGDLIEIYDMSELTKHMESGPGFKDYTKKDINKCLNGIAYDDVTDQLVVTGKKWPYIYEIKLIEN